MTEWAALHGLSCSDFLNINGLGFMGVYESDNNPWDEWKRHVNEIASKDLHDLANRLGLKKGEGNGANRLYHSPNRADKNPSLSIFSRNGGMGWKDHTSDEGGADAISLHQYCRSMPSFGDTVRSLAEMYCIPAFVPNAPIEKREKTLVEHIGDQVLAGDTEQARAYLKTRGITDEVIDLAIQHRAVGWNTWTHKDKQPGEKGYGGAGVAFVVRDRHEHSRTVAVDVRYLDPLLNGGPNDKTRSQGEKVGAPFVLNWRRFAGARTVVICESAINALSVLSCGMPYWDALATRGVSLNSVPVDVLKGKFVILAMDYDKPKEDNSRPGPEAAWKFYAHITASGIPCIMVDQLDWEEGWDLNDILKAEKPAGLKRRLQKWETCPIPGYYAGETRYPGKQRYYLPADDYSRYWRYQVAPDLTKIIDKVGEDEDGNRKTLDVADVANFRVADISRVNIQSWEGTVYGGKVSNAEMLFAVQVQTPQHGNRLTRRVMDDKQFTDPAHWGQFGYVYRKPEFMRLVSILSRTLEEGERTAVNYVGLCYKEGKLVVNDAHDCYFKDILRQCPSYGNLIFNNGSKEQGRAVLKAFMATFKHNAGTLPLVWALGANLKIHLGFYPHMQMEAEKGSGKSTFLQHLGKACQVQVFSTKQFGTAYRVQQSVAYSSQPVVIEEFSKLKTEAKAAADEMLQQTFGYAFSVWAGTLPMIYSTPVLLTGEEVDVKSLLGKLTRTTLTFAKQGAVIPKSMPVFPMRQWLEWLAGLDPSAVEHELDVQFQRCMADSRADAKDANAKRIVKSFAVLRMAWQYLCDYLELPTNVGHFEHDLVSEMNAFLKESEAQRRPWVWIVDIIFGEIDAHQYRYPKAFDEVDGRQCLLIRHQHMMQHIGHSANLKDRFNELPIKQGKTLLKQLMADGVVITLPNGTEKYCEKRVEGKRISHMIALDLEKLAQFGLHITSMVDETAEADDNTNNNARPYKPYKPYSHAKG